MKKFYLLLFSVCLIQPIFSEEHRYFVDINEEDFTDNKREIINTTLYRTVKKYFCRSSKTQDQQQLLYGTKAWMFPKQDVNLTLTYPPASKDFADENVDYILTELKVILYLEGAASKGYITDGGMLQNHVSITFILSKITRLSYQFWMFGLTKPTSSSATEGYQATLHNIC